MATLVVLLDGTVPVAADFNGNFNALNIEARPATAGGTGFSGYGVGDTLHASSAIALAKLAISTPYRVYTVNALGTLPEWVALQMSELTGLTLSRAAVDVDHDTTVARGACWSQDATLADRHFMALPSALTKRIDAAWSVGDGNGGLDTGVVGNNTWYHLWLIKRVDTGVVDMLHSTSATAPTMPANYTKKRRIGSVLTGAGANIRSFSQVGDHFLLHNPTGTLDFDSAVVTTARSTITLLVPPGFKVLATFNALISNAGAAVVYFSADADDDTPSTTAGPLGQLRCIAGGTSMGQITMRTSLTSTVFVRSDTAATTVRISTLSWIDRRGRDD